MQIHNAVITGSFAYNGVDISSVTSSTSNITSLNAITASILSTTASLNTASGSAITRLNAIESTTGSLNTASGSAITRLNAIEVVTGSNISRLSSIEAKTGSYATTGSNVFVGSQTITGSILGSGSLSINGCIVSTGQIVAQTINVQQVTSSIVYSCGSNIFGTALNNTQTICGNIFATGSVACFAGTICTPTVLVSGAVGIGGVTSPSQCLEVNGIIKSSGTGGSFMFTNRNCSTATWEWYSQGALGSSFAGLYKSYCSANTVLVVTDGGNVGINTTTPTSVGGVALMVYDSSTPRIRLSNSTTGTASTDGGELSLFACDFNIENRESSGAMNLYTNGSLRLKVTNDGKVGIATTTTPNDQLVIGEDLGGFGSGYNALTIGCSTKRTGIFIGQCPQNNVHLVWTCSSVVANAYAQLTTYNYSNPLYIDASKVVLQSNSSGYVGVGATAPVYNLHVCCSNNVAYIAVETGTCAASMEATFLQKTPDGISLIALGASPARGLGDAARCDWAFGLRTGGCLRFSGQVAANNTHFLLAPNGVGCFASTVCGLNFLASSNVQASGATSCIIVNRTDGTPAVLQLGNAQNGFQMQFTCTGGQRFAFLNGAPSEIASFFGTGVACFASRVLASNSGVDGIFQDAFVGVYSSNSNEQNAIQTAVSSNAANSGFLFMVSCGAGLSTRSCGYKMVRNSHTFYANNDAVAYIESGMLSSNGAGCFKSRSDARVLFLRQTTVNSDNIVQFVDHNGTNIWEVVGRNQQFYIYNAAVGNYSMCINPNTNAVHFPGAVSKGSGTFNIEHPLESKKCTHRLVHSFIEGPQADLIYRGVTSLTNGIACVNIDCAARMSEGTFEALNRCAQVFTTNESSWDAIRGKIHGNILVIESQNTSSTDEISWMVIGERQDKHIRETSITDEFGRIVVEPEIREDEKFTCICNQ